MLLSVTPNGKDVATCASLFTLSECILVRNKLGSTSKVCVVSECQVPALELAAAPLPRRNPTTPYLLFCGLRELCWSQWICHYETCFRIRDLVSISTCNLTYVTCSTFILNVNLWNKHEHVLSSHNSHPWGAVSSCHKTYKVFFHLTSCRNYILMPHCWLTCVMFSVIKCFFLWWWAAVFAVSQNLVALVC